MTPLAALRIDPKSEVSTPRSEAAPAPGRKPTRAATLELLDWVRAYIAQANLKLNAFATLVGYHRATISKLLDGKYDAEDQSEILAALKTFRDKIEGPGGLSKVIGFRTTRTATYMMKALDQAYDGHLVVMIGESGDGKTEAIREAIRRTSGSGKKLPIYIEATVFTAGPPLVAALAKEVGVNPHGHPDVTLRAIVGKLARDPRPIVVDEAHYVHERGLEALRQIRDMSGVGLLIIGTVVMAGVTHGKLGQADLMNELLLHRPHLRQVIDRAMIIPVPGLGDCEAEDIATSVLGRIAPDGLDRILLLVGRSMRRLVRLVDQIRQDRGHATAPVTAAEVDRAWQRLYPLPKAEVK